MNIVPADSTGIARAVTLLRDGHCVAFPTETVYGLGADATQDAAVARIYAAKGRPQFNPLIIHVAAAEELSALVIWSDDARLLAQRFWPGPLTLVLPAASGCPISLLARAGLPSLAVRVPDHPVALALLQALGRPIAAPSANRSGKLSPTTPLHVRASLGDAVPLILAGGKTSVGVESTILDMTAEAPLLLRQGGVSQEQIEACLGRSVTPVTLAAGAAPTAPGQLSSHYAPSHALRLNVTTARDDEAYLLFGKELGLRGGKVRLNLSQSGDLHEAAANLFSMLHELDSEDCGGIAVSPIPEIGLGRAINDRLRRAAEPGA